MAGQLKKLKDDHTRMLADQCPIRAPLSDLLAAVSILFPPGPTHSVDSFSQS